MSELWQHGLPSTIAHIGREAVDVIDRVQRDASLLLQAFPPRYPINQPLNQSINRSIKGMVESS